MALADRINLQDAETVRIIRSIQRKRGFTTAAGTARALIYEHPDVRRERDEDRDADVEESPATEKEGA